MYFGSTIKTVTLFVVLIMIASMRVCDSHACNLLSHQGSWVYEGDIGLKNIPISAAINFNKNDIKALYAYTNSTGDIALQGKVSPDGKIITLEEITKDGVVKERFAGKFAELDPRGKDDNEKLSCQVIVGEWYDSVSQQTHPFYLRLNHSTGEDIKHRYSPAGVSDDEIIHKAIAKLKRAIRKGDRKLVASMVEYPIRVRVDGNLKTLKNQSQLVNLYSKVFTPSFKDEIFQAHGRNLFAKSSGVMLGNGSVWFNENGTIIALNN